MLSFILYFIEWNYNEQLNCMAINRMIYKIAMPYKSDEIVKNIFCEFGLELKSLM